MHYVAALKDPASEILPVSKANVLFNMKFLAPASRKITEVVEWIVTVASELPIYI